MKNFILVLLLVLSGCASQPYVIHNRGEYMQLMTNCMAVHPYMPSYEAWDICEETVNRIIVIIPNTDKNGN